MKYTGPKVRLSRQIGIALTPKAQKIMDKKAYPPGVHGRIQQFRRKESDYKKQLMEKQRLRYHYNIHERQLSNYFKKASRQTGNRVDNFIQQLETRLDAVILRAGLARTIYAARQYISHGHIEVNGRKVDIASYAVAIGDVISVREKSRKNMDCFAYALETMPPPPDYVARNVDEMSASLTKLPLRDEVPVTCEVPLVVEFYSR